MKDRAMGETTANILSKASEAWRDVMALYAGAMMSAQILERELVQVLYFLRIGSGELRKERFYWEYHQMMGMKPRKVLDYIRGCGGNLSHESQEAVKKALLDRNFLAHGFFHKYKPAMSATQCKRAGTMLRKIESDLNAAHGLLQPLRQELENRLGLSVHRQSKWEGYLKKFVDAISSFNDGES
jgi:hypothetical protein